MPNFRNIRRDPPRDPEGPPPLDHRETPNDAHGMKRHSRSRGVFPSLSALFCLALSLLVLYTLHVFYILLSNKRGWPTAFTSGTSSLTQPYKRLREPPTTGSVYNPWSHASKFGDSKLVLALYTPLFHEFPAGVEAWGKGWTAWDGVGSTHARQSLHGYPVVRPFDGFYNPLSRETRARQAALAQAYGVSGFVYYHYWVKGAPSGEGPLEALLGDPSPMPFALIWEGWGQRLRRTGGSASLWVEDEEGGGGGGGAATGDSTSGDGGDGGSAGEAVGWKAHFQWLLPYFRHPLYISQGGRPLLFVAREGAAGSLVGVIRAWKAWAVEEGLPGLHVVFVGGLLEGGGGGGDASGLLGAADGYVAFPAPGTPTLTLHQQLLQRQGSTSTPTDTLTPYLGVHTSFNNAPLFWLSKDVRPFHPVNFRASLAQALALTHPGDFVLVHSWNEWGEGAALEPSVESGHAWLQGVKWAVESSGSQRVGRKEQQAFGFMPPIPLAGLAPPAPAPPPSPPNTPAGLLGRGGGGILKPVGAGTGGSTPLSGGVCFVVRTYVGHSVGGLYDLHKMLSTLVALENRDWEAFVVDTGEVVFEGMAGIVEGFGDARIHAFPTPPAMRLPYDSRTSSYDLTDFVVEQACLGRSGYSSSSSSTIKGVGGGAALPHPPFQWFIVTNGDNFYAPDALTLTSPPYPPPDLLLMNFNSRYTLANALTFTNSGTEHCCSRLANYPCTPSSPDVGFIDVGAMVVSTGAWVAGELSFAQFHGACGQASCHDGALARHVANKLGWVIARHPPTACAFQHNPNPVSCALVGGIYFDSKDWGQARCFEPSDFASLPISMDRVDWVKFMGGQGGCVCEKGD